MNAGQISRRKLSLLSLLAVGVVAAIVGVAAAIPDPNGVFDGCYNNRSGKLRVVEDPSECNNRETATFWNQQGPQGLAGAPGTPGVLDIYLRSVEQSFTPETTFQFNFEAYCDSGDKVTGGGVYMTGFTEVEEYFDHPVLTLDGWQVHGLYTGDAPVTVTLYAVCANLPDPPE